MRAFFIQEMNPTATPAAPPAATTSDQALGNLQQYEGSLESPQAALDAAKGSLGVNSAQSTATGLQGAIQNTTNLLNQVAPSVYGRTGNSLVTDAQATKQIGNESAPLQTTLAKEGTDYTNAEDTYKTLLGEAGTEAQNTLSDENTRAGLLQDIYSNLSGKEQNAADLAEKQREANLSATNATDVAHITAGAGLGGGSGGSSAATPQAFSTYKNGKDGSGGTNFTDSSGKSISAATYASLTGKNVDQVIGALAASGDQYAKEAYNEISKNLDYYQKNPQVLKTEFAPLFWGS